MKVRNKYNDKIYEVHGVSGEGFSRWISRSYEIGRYLIWDFGYKWVVADDFELI